MNWFERKRQSIVFNIYSLKKKLRDLVDNNSPGFRVWMDDQQSKPNKTESPCNTFSLTAEQSKRLQDYNINPPTSITDQYVPIVSINTYDALISGVCKRIDNNALIDCSTGQLLQCFLLVSTFYSLFLSHSFSSIDC